MVGRRDILGSLGILMVAIGLAHREAFFSWAGAILVTAGFATLLAAALHPPKDPGRPYPILLAVLCVVAALAPFDPAGLNISEAVLTGGAALVFFGLGATAPTRRYRLYAAAALLLAAHIHFLVRFPSPQHEDVWHFLNAGVDLLARGVNPYLGVPIVEGEVHKTLTYTYPPGALVELAPFRLLLGDVRWAYIVSEAVVVLLWGWFLGSCGQLTRSREALVLIPLALPRTTQAFYIFSNHEWELIALALGGLILCLRRRDAVAGVLLGLGIASKQYFIVYPFLFLRPVLRRQSVLVALVVAAVIVLPFLAWGPGPFIQDVLGNLSQEPVPDRLTLWAMFANAGIVIPRWALLLLTTAGILVTLGAAWRTRHDLSRSLLACGLSLALFAFCSSFAAYNYYAYALVFITWGLLLPVGREVVTQPGRDAGPGIQLT
jgi:hypothetical protein